MSITTPPVSTGTDGAQISGTSGSTLSSDASTELNGKEFLNLMMVQLENQDPTSPSTQDPTQFLTELAQMTQVEQETDTASSTSQTASEQAVSTAVSLIGDNVTYIDQTTGQPVSGSVQSVQISSSGPTLTVGGVAGISPSTVASVTPTGATTTVTNPTASSTTAGTGDATS